MPSIENFRHDKVRQEEVPNIICAKLAFNAIHCFSKRACHDSCVVDQDINPLDASVDICGSLSYGRLAAEIDADELRLDLWIDGVNAINDWLDLGQGATSKDDQEGEPAARHVAVSAPIPPSLGPVMRTGIELACVAYLERYGLQVLPFTTSLKASTTCEPLVDRSNFSIIFDFVI